MNGYVCNRTCQCPRCRARGMMGAAVLITLGVLFLIQELTYVRFEETFPALLIVIGVMLFLGRSASTEGHVQPPQAMTPMTPPPPPVTGNQPGPEVNR
jgi:hypothetical protein